MHHVRGTHILGSGKDFQFGADRPSSRSSSDAMGTQFGFGGAISKTTEIG